MHEKLIENWLDNSSERSYQQVFVQMLNFHGYTVLHSTRHCLLEFGKDILAIAPDGVGCAFQLKGDPKGQMRIDEFRRDIQPQMIQLVTQAPLFPGFPSGYFRSYLVTNGSVSEEVQVAITSINLMPYPSKIEIWSRGTLLDMSLRAAHTLWPSELQDSRRLLEVYLDDPLDQIDIKTMAETLSSVLRLDNQDKHLSLSEFKRVISSCMWITSIITSGYAEAYNHQAVCSAWTICRTHVQACALKNNLSVIARREVEVAFQLCERAILDSLCSLWAEVNESKSLVLSPPLEDSVIYSWRIATLRGMLSSLFIFNSKQRILDDSSTNNLTNWLVDCRECELWGEGASSQFGAAVLALIFLQRRDLAEELLVSVLEQIVDSNKPDSLAALPNPYYSSAESISILFGLADDKDPENFAGASFAARTLFLAMVELGMKQACQELWADLSRITHRFFVFSSPEDFLMFRVSSGMDLSKIYPANSSWSLMKEEARLSERQPFLPVWLESLWWQVAPNRFDSNSFLSAIRGVVSEQPGMQ